MNIDEKKFVDKLKGVIYGQAIGDALGLGTEFMNDEDIAKYYPHGLRHYSDIVQDRHRHRWKKGEWTDNTDMMLLIAKAFRGNMQFDLQTIASYFKVWAQSNPRGIGEHTYKVLLIGDYVDKPQDVAKVIWEISGRKAAANGAVMRTSIVGLFPDNVVEYAANICRLTHYDPRCVGSCVIVSNIIHNLVYENVAPSYEMIVSWGNQYDERIKEYIDLAQNEDLRALNLQDSKAMGYTLKTLAAGLWAYWHAKSFEEGLLAVVNAGGDADTNAAVAGAILGAKFGYETIPKEYINGLVYRKHLDRIIESMTDDILPPSDDDMEILLRIAMWPMYYLNKLVKKVHADMDAIDPDNPFLGEDKRAIGVGGASMGCIMTIIWWMFLIALFITGCVLLVKAF